MIDLDAVFDDDRAPGAALCERRGPAADAGTATDWRAELTDAERRLFPADVDPPAQFVADVLAVRREFGVEIASVGYPSGESDPAGIRASNLPEPWLEWWAERAAIREFDGEQARDFAEAEALKETLAAMRLAEISA